MNLVLIRMGAIESLPKPETESTTVFDEASALFGYEVPQNEKRRKSEFLRTKLQELKIFPYTDESVLEYQMAAVTARTLELAKDSADVDKGVSKLFISLCATVVVVLLIISFLVQAPRDKNIAWFFAGGAGLAMLINFWRYNSIKISDFIDDFSVRWNEESLMGYRNRIPIDVLEMAVLIKKTLPDVVIIVDEIEDYANHFLSVVLGQEKYYIACYERQHPPSPMAD